MSRRLRATLVLVLVVMMGVIAYVGTRGYRAVAHLIALTEEVDRSRAMLVGLREVLSQLRAAESSQRGFLLTGRPDYLGPYEAAGPALFARLDELVALGAGGVAEAGGLARLRVAAREKFAEMGRTIAIRRAGRSAEAVALVRTDVGESLKREIRAILARVEGVEVVRLEATRREAAGAGGESRSWLLALLGGTLLVVAGLCAATVGEIGERRRAEAGLRESEAQFRGGFEAAAIGMALVGLDGRWLRVNRALCESVGYAEAELLATDSRAITHPDDLAADLVLVARLLAGAASGSTLEKRYLHKAGHVVHVVIGVSLVRDASGRPSHLVVQINDVTGRVLAERQASEERRFIESVADAVPSVLYLYDLEGHRVVWANARHLDVFGRTLEEVAAMDGGGIDPTIYPEDRPRLAEHRERLRDAADAAICEIEYRTRHADGSWRWLRCRDLVFDRDAEGRAVRALGVGEDVTESRRLQSAFREETELRRAIVEVASYPILSCDAGGTIRMFNPAAERMLGYEAAEVVGVRSLGLFHDPAEILARAEGLAAGGGTAVEPGFGVLVASIRPGGCEERDWTYIRKDGVRVPVRVSMTSLCDAAGAVEGFVAIANDLTDRLRAEAGLRAQLVDAIESLDSGLVMYDADERLVICNRRYREMCPSEAGLMTPGVSLEEVVRGSLCEGPPPAEGESLEEVVAGRLDLHRNRRGNHEQELGDRWFRIGDFATADGGVVSLRTDITELKRTERDLTEARDAARAALRAKAEFLANMSHEIRTPMNGVLGMAELAMGTALSARQREYVAAIRSSAEGLMTVINDVLDFSKVDAGKLDLDRAPFDLRECLDDTLRVFAPTADEKGLELCAWVRAAVPGVVLGDPHRLRQVLINLVGNAIKFTERGEVVVLVEVDGPPGPDGQSVALAFSVLDTGIGVPESRRGAIFDPFEQGDGSTTRRFGGTGLGLAISSRLVALMGGELAVEPRPEGGSLFRFTAKFGRPADDEGPTLAAAVPGALVGLPVLIVDKHPTGRAILAELLTSWRMEPTAVADPAAAAKAIRVARSLGRPFAAAVVDGDFAARAVVSDAELPLILITTDRGDTPPHEGRPAMLAVFARLTKPVRQSDLYNALSALVDPSSAGEGRAPVAPSPAAVPPALPAKPLRLLLAEDNPVNQIVATHMLERLGHAVIVVGDGRASLSALESGLFDLVLMDLQMPQMDGFEAVAAIRDRERSAPDHARTPVVALTAHAMAGDRERCLAAGFDAYLSKPIRIADLTRVLAGLVAADPAPDPPPAAVRAAPASGSFRPRLLAESCDGVVAIIDEVLDSFLVVGPSALDRIGRALDDGDPDAVRKAAHALKGGCLTVGADALAVACQELERLCDGEAIPAPDATRARLARAWDDVSVAIEDYRGSLGLDPTAR